ncbi:hypothetical protein LG325_06610 [Marinobacter nauticus]
MLDSPQVKRAVRKAVAAIIGFFLAMALLTALLLTGFYLLVQAALLSLSPWLGEAGALWLVGFVCLLLLALFFLRLVRPGRASDKQRRSEAGPKTSGIDALRDLIRKNPWESVLMAFAVGIAEQGDARLRSLLLQGGTILMKQAETPPPTAPDGSDMPDQESGAPPEPEETH